MDNICDHLNSNEIVIIYGVSLVVISSLTYICTKFFIKRKFNYYDRF